MRTAWALAAILAAARLSTGLAALDLPDRLASAVLVADTGRVAALLAEAASNVQAMAVAPVDVRRVDGLGRTALMVCGMDPQLASHADTAAACGHIATGLLASGADANAVDGAGWSCAAYAASMGWASVVRALAGKGADVNRADDRGVAPLAKVWPTCTVATDRNWFSS